MMKKTFKIKNLDCAHCALKIEDGIKALPNVESASVSLLAEKITITADEANFPGILKQAAKIVKKVEPDCEVDFK